MARTRIRGFYLLLLVPLSAAQNSTIVNDFTGLVSNEGKALAPKSWAMAGADPIRPISPCALQVSSLATQVAAALQSGSPISIQLSRGLYNVSQTVSVDLSGSSRIIFVP